ncbi:MAG: hypothetical protein K6348_06610 [Deferribacterales bacterium]
MKNVINLAKIFPKSPFHFGDITAGIETELHTSVQGDPSDVDLPQIIINSKYYKNVVRRVQVVDTSATSKEMLNRYLSDKDKIWDNSWVRVPVYKISPDAFQIFMKDLLKDKRRPDEGYRSDATKFFITIKGEQFIRIPISYLFKLAIVDYMITENDRTSRFIETGLGMIKHYINDNTSPELSSFFVIDSEKSADVGYALAKENSVMFLFTQLLVEYAHKKFELIRYGQRVDVYKSPLPPVKQKKLNEIISDNFYRELFMNPCLSGWDKGEDKKEYMALCHIILSRSRLNTLTKLKEAGFFNGNLVMMPNTSNTSLSNNGVHISIGSKLITEYIKNDKVGMGRKLEKYYADLSVKIVEHFLPLFIGNYSASCYRIGFKEFHPEIVLGFLPHELDYTHLRMLWRRWQKKAGINFLGQKITPVGYNWLDEKTKKIFNLKGDYVPDYRLIDYFMALMSTEESPAFDGTLDNEIRLKEDLMNMGAFHKDMSFYTLYKPRLYHQNGFSGFEGRFYSLFDKVGIDLKHAVNLQILITALAYKYIMLGIVKHPDIPDTPTVESERRQIIFGAAAGIDIFNIDEATGNNFLKMILKDTKNIKVSRRYKGFLKVNLLDYQKGLLSVIKRDAMDIIEELNMQETIRDLEKRLDEPERRVEHRLRKKICRFAGVKSPFDVDADEFNLKAEEFYRVKLKVKHMHEGVKFLKEDLQYILNDESLRAYLYEEFKDIDIDRFIDKCWVGIMDDNIGLKEIRSLLKLIIISVWYNKLFNKGEDLIKEETMIVNS